MLTSLTDACGSLNMAGLSALEYLPVAGIDKTRYRYQTTNKGTEMAQIPLLSAYNWLSVPIIPVADNEQFWDETMNADGTVTANATLVLPVNTPSVRKTLDDMRVLEKYVIRLTDKNRVKIIVGSLPFPLIFSAVFNSNRGAFTLRFTGKQHHLAKGYTF